MIVLILNASPHLEKGVTGSIITAFESGLKKTGSKVIKREVYRLDIKPCQGCFSCWTDTPGKCIHEDDMEDILKLWAESDIVVLATPVYIDGMTGPMKTLLDRLIPLFKGKGRVKGQSHEAPAPKTCKEGQNCSHITFRLCRDG